MSSELNCNTRRILLKISGEALSGDCGFGIDPSVLSNTAKAIRAVQNEGVQTVLVIGGGIAGILCAYMLRENGVNCILVEADRIWYHRPGSPRKCPRHGRLPAPPSSHPPGIPWRYPPRYHPDWPAAS